jgi:hypothetical protein
MFWVFVLLSHLEIYIISSIIQLYTSLTRYVAINAYYQFFWHLFSVLQTDNNGLFDDCSIRVSELI